MSTSFSTFLTTAAIHCKATTCKLLAVAFTMHSALTKRRQCSGVRWCFIVVPKYYIYYHIHSLMSHTFPYVTQAIYHENV